MSLIFKTCLGVFIFAMATHVARWVQLPKYMDKLSTSGDHIKGKHLKLHRLLVTVYKLFFWISPLYIIVIYVVYSFARNDTIYVIGLVILVYTLVIEDYLFRRRVLRQCVNNLNLEE